MRVGGFGGGGGGGGDVGVGRGCGRGAPPPPPPPKHTLTHHVLHALCGLAHVLLVLQVNHLWPRVQVAQHLRACVCACGRLIMCLAHACWSVC